MTTAQSHLSVETSALGWKRAVATYALFAVGAFAVLHAGFFSMIDIWRTASYGHGALAAPLSILMIFASRGQWRALSPQLWRPGLILIAAGGVLYALGVWFGINLVQHSASVLILISGAAAIFGRAVFKVWLFPLAYLVFMVPFGESFLPALKTIAAHGAHSLLTLLGADVTLRGDILSTSVGAFRVADACAGFRFLMASLMLSSFFAWLAYDDWRKQTVIVIAASAIALIANAIRVSLIVLLAIRSNGTWEGVHDHAAFGVIVYGAVFIFVLVVAAAFGSDARQRRVA